MPSEPAMETWIFLAERGANPAVGIPPISPGQIERLRNAVVALTIGALFVGSMTLWSWVVNDAVDAVHVLTDFLMPLGLVWISLFVYMIWLGLQRRRFECFLIACLWLMIALAFNGSVAGILTSAVEVPRDRKLSDEATPLRTMIVLGGSVFVTYDGEVEVSPEGQRVVLAAQYWHAGRTKSIVVSGGQSAIENEPHSGKVRGMLESLNVPSSAIFEISTPTNTAEEMEELSKFFRSPPANFPKSGDVGLVTSAYHMERSMRLANDRGLSRVVDLVPMPCCYRRGVSYGFTPRSYIPRANSGGAFSIALKEILAEFAGR